MPTYSSIPIIFIHTGNHDYLPLSILQLKQSNPQADVWLLGDAYNKHFSIWLKHRNLYQYFDEASRLAKVFINYSSNPHQFELICLQRWMALYEFMIKTGMEYCLYIDSDVLVYDDVRQYASWVAHYGMTVAGISGHTNFIMKRDVLGEYVQLIADTYHRSDAKQWLEHTYAEFRKYNTLGGISDMTFFTEYRKLHPNKVFDAWQPINGKACDITINYHQGYEHTAEGNKVIYWQQGKPYCKTVQGELIQFITLHFQGESKRFMPAMMPNYSGAIQWVHSLNKLHVLASKVMKKLL